MEVTRVSGRKLADLIVNTLNLEGVDYESVNTTEPLFGGGLDLDSLDMLEIALLLQQQFGVTLKADDPETKAIFRSLDTLADHINAQTASSPVSSPA